MQDKMMNSQEMSLNFSKKAIKLPYETSSWTKVTTPFKNGTIYDSGSINKSGKLQKVSTKNYKERDAEKNNEKVNKMMTIDQKET